MTEAYQETGNATSSRHTVLLSCLETQRRSFPTIAFSREGKEFDDPGHQMTVDYTHQYMVQGVVNRLGQPNAGSASALTSSPWPCPAKDCVFAEYCNAGPVVARNCFEFPAEAAWEKIER